MHCSEGLQNWKARNEALRTRLLDGTRAVDAAMLMQHSDAGAWSPAQIVEHLVLTNGPYLQTIQNGLQNASRGAKDMPVRYSFFGKQIIRASGPNGNAPVPKALKPTPDPVWQTVLATRLDQQAQLLTLLDQAAGTDLSGEPVGNPIFPIIRMNVADCFELLTGHTERHVGQIEARVRPLQKSQ